MDATKKRAQKLEANPPVLAGGLNADVQGKAARDPNARQTLF
jgi:hypothetical protein